MNLIAALKEQIGYTTKFNFEADMSTDNFGPGDKCTRNPDIPFSVDVAGTCTKWSEKVKRDHSA